jgi:signal transduction histidine kinase/CheY-like chemotaxis protein
MWGIAERTAEVESLNQGLEDRVAERTHQLAAANQNLQAEINERKAAQADLERSEEQLRQSQKMDAIGQLAGGVAHDFNNLLTAICGHSELSLKRLTPADPLYRPLEQIKKSGERAAGLTRQLLAFSRKQMLQPKIIDLNQIVVDMNKMLQRLIGEDIDLLMGLAADLGKVKADPNQIEQILLNLSINARDAMPKGGRLTIETGNVTLGEEYSRDHVSVLPGQYVMLAVSDNGCGMDPNTQAHIFEPFFTTKEVGKGTGLGLATVYGIVQQSGGTIWLYSEVGRGTAFKIYLPCAEALTREVEVEADDLGSLQGTETILLVEDEDVVREMATEILRESGYRVLEAKHGPDAMILEKQHSGVIDLMLTDVVMPQMSGRELAEQLTPLRRDMRVLYMSGYTDDAIVHHGVLEEGTAFIGKPFTPKALARKVREILDVAVTN